MRRKSLAILVITILAIAPSTWATDIRPDQDRIERDFTVFDTTADFVTGGTSACPDVTTMDVWVRYFRRTEDGHGVSNNELIWTRETKNCHGVVTIHDGGTTKPESSVVVANVSKGLLVVLPGSLGNYIYTFDPSTKAERHHEGTFVRGKKKHKEKTTWFWRDNPAALVMPTTHGAVRVGGRGEMLIKVRNVLRQGIGGF